MLWLKCVRQLLAQGIERPPGVREIIGSNPIEDSFFFPLSHAHVTLFSLSLFYRAVNSPSLIYNYLPHIHCWILAVCRRRMSYKNSVKWPRSPWVLDSKLLVVQWIQRPLDVLRVIGSNPIRDLGFFSLFHDRVTLFWVKEIQSPKIEGSGNWDSIVYGLVLDAFDWCYYIIYIFFRRNTIKQYRFTNLS